MIAAIGIIISVIVAPEILEEEFSLNEIEFD
jgi:hypothetical protein